MATSLLLDVDCGVGKTKEWAGVGLDGLGEYCLLKGVEEVGVEVELEYGNVRNRFDSDLPTPSLLLSDIWSGIVGTVF